MWYDAEHAASAGLVVLMSCDFVDEDLWWVVLPCSEHAVAVQWRRPVDWPAQMLLLINFVNFTGWLFFLTPSKTIKSLKVFVYEQRCVKSTDEQYILVNTHLSLLNKVGDHYYTPAAFLPNHSPHVLNGPLVTTCTDNNLLPLIRTKLTTSFNLR